MLCLAQFVRLTDLHVGNIICTPWGPAVTDAECFATPNLHRPPWEKNSQEHAPISDALEAILSTGLLPRKRDRDQPDVSGFFAHATPVSAVRLPAWFLGPEGRYHLTPVGADLVAHRNAPRETTPLAVLPQILSGYRHAAELLIRARITLLAPGSQWRSVLEKLHAPRIVLRDTLTYGWLLSRSLEPQYLRSFYRRRNVILAELQSHSGQNLPSALLRAERNAILQLHIPRLTILPGSRTLATGPGRVIARRFTASTPAQSVLESIETLSTESIDNLHVPALLSTIL
jgi:lantibiotic modifying enzyme